MRRRAGGKWAEVRLSFFSLCRPLRRAAAHGDRGRGRPRGRRRDGRRGRGESVLGSWVGARHPFQLSLFLISSRMALPQDPSTDPKILVAGARRAAGGAVGHGGAHGDGAHLARQGHQLHPRGVRGQVGRGDAPRREEQGLHTRHGNPLSAGPEYGYLEVPAQPLARGREQGPRGAAVAFLAKFNQQNLIYLEPIKLVNQSTMNQSTSQPGPGL